jgi:putative protease
MENTKPREIELLAPARDAATAFAAIDHGADAVYMGASAFGARQQAANELDEIKAVADYAHKFGVKLYVTVNTIVYETELTDVERLIWDLWRAGVDALIVQDLAITQMKLPPIALHASTQCDTRTPDKAQFLESLGFTRLVLARELTLDEIRSVRNAVRADLEVFVHGALCVSFSGNCQASYVLTGRSANRGECCQVCRFKFDLEDEAGHKLVEGKHLLSLRDMNRFADLEALLDAGASSLKIEGRLKDVAYVKTIVGAYRRELDRIIAANPERYCRSSYGTSKLTFEPNPAKSFNRGFTNYFLTQRQPEPSSLATFNSPKWTGLKVGKVEKMAGKVVVAKLRTELHNGDGLGYFNEAGEFVGFRLNRVEGNKLFPAVDINIPSGTILYRNSDKQLLDILAGKTAERRIQTKMQLEMRGSQIVLTLEDEVGHSVAVAEAVDVQQARTPQEDRRRKELEKLGDTIFVATEVRDLCGNLFIPASQLSHLRRRGIEMLEMAQTVSYQREKPGNKSADVQLSADYQVTRHDNIANSVAAELYAKITDQQASQLPRAIECTRTSDDRQVMETRYCLRREMGCCLKTKDARRLPNGLYLVSEGNRFRLEFDCANCRMKVMY